MPDTTWVSAHAFYHGELDRLLLDVTAPLVADLADAGLATRFFFIRYWAGGPHLRLRVLPARAPDRAEVAHRMRESFEKYFAQHPSADRMTQAEYADTAEWLSGVEGAPYPDRLYPNNSVAFLPYEREHGKYGYGRTIEAVEHHFAESSRLVLDVLGAQPSADHRSTAAAAMLLLAWFTATDDPARLAEWTRENPLLAGRPEPELGTAEQQQRLVELSRRMRLLAGSRRGLDGEGALLRWVRSVGTLANVLDAGGHTWPRAVFRVLNSCAHLVCNRLGVQLAEEDALRHRAAHALELLAREGD